MSVPEQAFNNSQELLLEMQLGRPLPGTLQLEAGMLLLSEILAMSVPTTAHQISKQVDNFSQRDGHAHVQGCMANASSPAFATTVTVTVTGYLF